ncbi:uncharacterized protein FN964_011522 isoform 2-T2 [Alca torda]
MLSPACRLPGSQRTPCWSRAGEKPAKPASDCSRLLLQRGKERRGAGASNSRLPTCTSPAGLGTAPGASIFSARIPRDVRGPRCSLLPREHLPAAARIPPGMESLSSSLKKKATEQHYRAEVMITGEQLRLRLHDGKLVKDRRYHLRTYPNCFVAKELTDWLIDHKEAPDRETGIRLMQKLMDHYIIHHVCDEHSDYKDAKLLYRFRKDDGTFPLSKDVKVFMRGQSLYEKLVSVEESILKVREENSVKYQRTFLGCEMIDWLVQEGEAENRKEAVELGRALLEHGIIQHGITSLTVTSSTNSGSTFDGGAVSQNYSMRTLLAPSPRAQTAPSVFASSTRTQETPAFSPSRPTRRSKLSQRFEGAASLPLLETPTPTLALLLCWCSLLWPSATPNQVWASALPCRCTGYSFYSFRATQASGPNPFTVTLVTCKRRGSPSPLSLDLRS